MKKILIYIIWVFIFISVILMSTLVVKAAKPEKLIYPTVQEVQQMISDAISPLQTAINNFGQRLTLVETALTDHNSEIQRLNYRVTTLENNQPETKVIILWENHIVQPPSGYTDWVDVDGYKNASILIKRTGDNVGYRAQFSVDGVYGQNESDGWPCSDVECYIHTVDIKGPKMRIYVEPFITGNSANVWVSLYLSK